MLRAMPGRTFLKEPPMKKNTLLLLIMLAGNTDFISCSNLYNAIQNELQTIDLERDAARLLSQLAESNPEIVEIIITDESNLKSTFHSIQHFIQARLHEINKLLSSKKNVAFQHLARLAIELADAQAALEKTIMQHLAQHKKHDDVEEAIKETLRIAELKLKELSLQSVNSAADFKKFIAGHLSQAKQQAHTFVQKGLSAQSKNSEQNSADNPAPVKSQTKKKYVIKKLPHQSKNKNQVANSADFQELKDSDEVVVVQLTRDNSSDSTNKKRKKQTGSKKKQAASKKKGQSKQS